jgi:hypothetical protein
MNYRFLIIIVSLNLFGNVAFAQNSLMNQGMEILNQAVVAQSQGDDAALKRHLDRAIDVAPRLGLAYHQRALYYFSLGDSQSACTDWGTAIPLLLADDQPIMSIIIPGFGPVIATKPQILGDAHILYGQALILTAQAMSDPSLQRATLLRAKTEIETGLTLDPDPMTRDLGQNALLGFRL